MAIWKDDSMAGLLAEVQGDQTTEGIQFIKITRLAPFKDHPFRLYSDAKMQEMAKSIEESGVLNPLLIRPIQGTDQYEIISGHNRCEAAKRAGLSKVPAIVKDVDDAMAAIMMVDTNFNQREEILPSEKAFAYKIKREAIKKQGQRTDLTSPHGAEKLNLREKMAKEVGESEDTILRYIRLTQLIPALLNKVDEGRLDFIPAVDISYLNNEQQECVAEILQQENSKPSKAKAVELKKRAKAGKLTRQDIEEILKVERKRSLNAWRMESKKLKEYLPIELQEEMTPEKADQIIDEAMQLWKEKYKFV